MSDSKILKTIYLVRHGQSEDNIAPVFQSTDSPLSVVGKKQAQQIANRASKISFEKLLSSPYKRAKETTNVISKLTGKKPEYSDLLTERKKPASVNGKPVSDTIAAHIYNEWQKSLYISGLRVEDGENFDDIISRADRALNFFDMQPESSILVVTHGFFLRTIIAKVLLGNALNEKTYRHFMKATSYIENTGLTIIRSWSENDENLLWHLWIYNDHAHLAE